MKSISSSVFGRLFGHPTKVIIKTEGITLLLNSRATDISWRALLSPPAFTRGLFGQTLTFSTKEQNYVLGKLAYNCAKEQKSDCERLWAESNKERLENLLAKISRLISRRYLRQSYWQRIHTAVQQEYNRWFPWSAASKSTAHLSKLLQLLTNYQHWQDQNIALCRAAYIDKQLKAYQLFFDKVESNPLTARQREACIIDDDNNLLLAGAGTGKTSVMVARAGYLLSSQQARNNEILLLAYGRKAADEMDQRIKDKLATDKISSSTFHSLGLNIIARVEGQKPHLSVFAEDEKAKVKWVQACLEALMNGQVQYRHALVEYFSKYYYTEKNEFEFASLGEHYQYLTDNDIRSLKGDKVKSFAELSIANWLFNHGIDYQYQADYAYNLRTVEHRQYQPDFFLPELNIYIEYFAIDENGDTAAYIDKKKYHESIQWKRNIHQQYNTQCIVLTYSQHNKGMLLDTLVKCLKDNNIHCEPLPDQVILANLKESGRVSALAELFAKLIGLYKGACLDDSAKKSIIAASADALQTQKAFALLKPVLQTYQKKLSERNEIDFEDMITKALAYVESGKFISPWRYIMVDEFQDISEPRARLVKALRDSHKGCSVFAVGDDWQAIYRFSGADVTLTTGFAAYFGPTTQSELDQTFRFNNRIGQLATDFVSKNPAQINKTIKSLKQVHAPAVSLLRKGSVNLQRDENIVSEIANGAVDEVLTAITEKVKKPAGVYLLARFRFQLPDKLTLARLKSQYPLLSIETHTFHAAKGKEADYVVLMGLTRGQHGFPCEKVTPAIMDALLAKQESFKYAEERRLFYVALTRAKERVYIIADMLEASPFVGELLDEHDIEVDEFTITVDQTLVEQIRCQLCETGTLQARKGRYGSFYSCSHFPRCDHKERACDHCGSAMTKMRYSGFKSCLNTSCKNIFPLCEQCGAEMVLRKGTNGEFWGCRNYRGNEPISCKNSVPRANIKWPVA